MDEKRAEQQFYESLGRRKWRVPWLIIGVSAGALGGLIYFDWSENVRDMPRYYGWAEIVLIGTGIGFVLGLASDLTTSWLHRSE